MGLHPKPESKRGTSLKPGYEIEEDVEVLLGKLRGEQGAEIIGWQHEQGETNSLD